MQLQIAAKPSVLCCHLANTNEELGGLATAIPPCAKLHFGPCYYYQNYCLKMHQNPLHCEMLTGWQQQCYQYIPAQSSLSFIAAATAIVFYRPKLAA